MGRNAEYVTEALAEAVCDLCKKGFPVLFADGLPRGICDLETGTKHPAGADNFCAEEGKADAVSGHSAGQGQQTEASICSPEKEQQAEAGICSPKKEQQSGADEFRGKEKFTDCRVVSLEELVPALNGLGLSEIRFEPENSYLRVLHYQEECGLYYFVNEGAQTYRGTVTVPDRGCCYVYDAWENACHTIEAQECPEGTRLSVTLEPRKSLIVLFDTAGEAVLRVPVTCEGEGTELMHWKRSICESAEYPDFREEKEVVLPDGLAQEKPDFSGFVRYESRFIVKHTGVAGRGAAGRDVNSDGTVSEKAGTVDMAGAERKALEQADSEYLYAAKLETECPAVVLPPDGRLILELTDAYEGVELFINGRSAGIQIVAPYRYDLTGYVKEGENRLAIEVATTLERKCYAMTKDDPRMKMRGLAEPVCGSGITGRVVLFILS